MLSTKSNGPSKRGCFFFFPSSFFPPASVLLSQTLISLPLSFSITTKIAARLDPDQPRDGTSFVCLFRVLPCFTTRGKKRDQSFAFFVSSDAFSLLSLFRSCPLSLFRSFPLALPQTKQTRQNLMKLGHNKSLALEEFARNNSPASPSAPSSLAPPTSLGNGGGGGSSGSSVHFEKNSSKLQQQLKPRPARSFREWQAGIGLFAGGNVLNFVSFGFAAQSLLAALGSVQFVSNVVFARLVLKEAVTWRVICATALIVTGDDWWFSERTGKRRKRKKGRKQGKKLTKTNFQRQKNGKQAASFWSPSATTAPSF